LRCRGGRPYAFLPHLPSKDRCGESRERPRAEARAAAFAALEAALVAEAPLGALQAVLAQRRGLRC
jgi:hypothetical protein